MAKLITFTLHNGEEYYFDCNALMKWVMDCPHNEQNVETQITQMFPNMESAAATMETDDGDEVSIDFIQREITETKNTKNDVAVATRVNLIMTFVNALLELECRDNPSFRHQVAANSLLQLGILKQIEK